MTLKGGTISACAACKYQRRKCIPECPLAPYFPADQPKVFQNAHKLFGVSNILKILRDLDPIQQAEAMRSIKYQANVRDRFPVHGCLGVIRQLYFQIQLLEEEFYLVNAQLEMCRQQQHHHHHQQHISMATATAIADEVAGKQLQLGMALPGVGVGNANPNNTLPLFNQLQHPTTAAAAVTLSSYSNSNSNSNSNVGYNYSSNSYMEDSKENKNMMMVNNSFWNTATQQHPFATNTNNNIGGCLMPIHQPHHHHHHQQQLLLFASQQQQQQGVQDYDEIHPFFDSIDDRQSYIDAKEAYDSSSEESIMKDTRHSVEHVAENELKSAAACFSLTSVN